MADHRDVIDDNIVFLCDKTNCTPRLLDKATEKKILTRDESREIERHLQGYDRNRALYDVIRRKDRDAFAKLLVIMKGDETKQSKDVLSILTTATNHKAKIEKSCALKSKWWPEEKLLVNSFYERKNNDGLLVEKLFKILTERGSKTAVISQKVTVSGFGGVGKTTMAKWYARHYEEKYDHIIWIDCGEGKLIKSFVELCVDLKVDRIIDSDLKKIARLCLQTLENEKCLFIFDNAERYVGCDGIIDALPKNEKFHSIITSRNREWGSESGYGQIQQIALDVFSTDESIRFLRANLKHKSIEEKNLKEMCDLLGNLPLALQIATSTLNKHSIGLADYIKIIQGTNQIIEKTFDDYEKTINSTLKTSLNFIKQGKDNSNQLAYKILLLFGYIQPDDIPMSFFQAVEVSESWEIQAVMDLLESYSLLSIKRRIDWCDIDTISYKYSIHRLLQHVIRFNNKDTEEATLRKILSCEGHTGIKLVPYSFASESLKKEFPKIRAELVDQPQLSELILSGCFEEACRLSGNIYTDFQTSASRFNLAICLKNCKMFDDSLSHLRQLFSYVSGTRDFIYGESELLSLGDEPNIETVGSQIFIVNMLKGDITEANEIVHAIPNIRVPKTDETMSCIIQAFKSNLFSGFNLHISDMDIVLNPHTDVDNGILLVIRNSVDDNVFQKRSLRDVTLLYASFTKEQSESLSAGDFFPPELTSLVMTTADSCIDGNEIPLGNPCICLNQLEHLQILELTNCTITLTILPLQMRLKCLFLKNVWFLQNDVILQELVLNDLMNFCSLNTVSLTCEGNEDSKILWFVHMMDNLNLDFVSLEGNSVICQNWEDANWTIGHLVLDTVQLKRNRMKIKDLELNNSSVELSDLPSTIQSLTLGLGVSINKSPQNCYLQNLKYLSTRPPVSIKCIIGLFDKFPNLVGLKFEDYYDEYDEYEFDLSALPSTICELHLEGVHVTGLTGDNVLHLERLVITGYTTAEASQILTYIHPEHLCYDIYVDKMDDTKLVDIIQNQFKSIVVGPITPVNFRKCELSSYVDEGEEYYIFQNQRGTSIDFAKFSDYLQFPPNERQSLVVDKE